MSPYGVKIRETPGQSEQVRCDHLGVTDLGPEIVEQITARPRLEQDGYRGSTVGPSHDYVIREARRDDAEQLAAFFRSAYGNSSHECQDAEHVRETIEQGSTQWFVAARQDCVLACAANIPHRWNRTYETCRIYSRPEYAGLTLGRRLYRQVLEAAYRSQDCEMQWGCPRSRGVYLMASRGMDNPVIIVGEDGGKNVANGARESHLMIVTRNPHRPIPRVIPPGRSAATAPFVKERILSHLSFTTTLEEYPRLDFVGPPATHRTRMGECVFAYDYDPDSPSRSLQLTSVEVPRADADQMAAALDSFVRRFPTVEHLSATVLIDKETLIRRMQGLGFAVAAYLPAWYLQEGKRYDCVSLVRRSFGEEPVRHGTAELLAPYDLNHLFD